MIYYLLVEPVPFWNDNIDDNDIQLFPVGTLVCGKLGYRIYVASDPDWTRRFPDKRMRRVSPLEALALQAAG